MKNGIRNRIATRSGLSLVLIAMIVTCSGCSQSGSGSGANGSYSGKMKVSSATGGAITVDIPDGTSVILEIPEGALETTTDLTLTVTPSGDKESVSSAKSDSADVYSNLSITVKPEVDLLETASVSVVFPSGAKNIERCLTLKTGALGNIPAKQGFLDSTLKSSVYRLGEWECSKPDLSDMLTAAYALMGKTPEGEWQDAYALFDALLYYSARFGENNKLTESQECFMAVADLCKVSADDFLKTSTPDGDSKDDIHVNALKKFRNLMVLCENPGDIVKSFDSQLLASDN